MTITKYFDLLYFYCGYEFSRNLEEAVYKMLNESHPRFAHWALLHEIDLNAKDGDEKALKKWIRYMES